MALDIKHFAIVARAENSIYMYVTADSVATVAGAHYFKSKDLSGYVKKDDVIMVVGAGKLAFFRVSAVTPNDGSITVVKAIFEA